MPRTTLWGGRYKTESNKDIQAVILDKLDGMDLDETITWYCQLHLRPVTRRDEALLACNDRFYLLYGLCNRVDLKHPWLFARCREVESDPDGYVDLWARAHGKSSIITFGGIVQDILRNPELTTAIFSVTRPIAQEFLGQIKNEFETNEHLKECFPDVLYRNPRARTPDEGRPSKWSLARGITVKRLGKPKEATVEAHGLIDGQPTGRHFDKHVYDDIVTQDSLTEEQLKKTTARFEMADNLGTRQGVRKQIAGTCYHFADAYAVIRERKSAKPRIYPATYDGTLNTFTTLPDGSKQTNLVLLDPENWERIKRDQRSVVSAQMLLNPMASGENTFSSLWLTPYYVQPHSLNVYILVDPSLGKGERSDRTAIVVIGIDVGGSKYLLDGACHRMRLTERWTIIKQLKAKWEKRKGVEFVKVGYERYGAMTDVEVIEDMMLREGNRFELHELNTSQTGGNSKRDRIGRLEPDLRDRRFLIPGVVYHPSVGRQENGFACYWHVWTQEDEDKTKAKAADGEGDDDFHVGQIIWHRARGLTKEQQKLEGTTHANRIVKMLRRTNEDGEIYDLTRIFMEEVMRHPFSAHDDLIDATSRIYDIEPTNPQHVDAESTYPFDLDIDELRELRAEDSPWGEPHNYGDEPGSMGIPF